MPIVNNESNINRMNLKMSEDFYHATDVKLSDSINYFEPTIQPLDYSNEEKKSCVPMYATCSESVEVTSSDLKTQTSESEVQSLKEWLLLHNDLIQQQNDDILDKERQIFFLKRQNKILREQLNCIEKGIPYDPEKFFANKSEDVSEETCEEDMTEDSSNPYVDSKEQVLQQRDDVVSCSLEVINYGSNHISDTESQVDTTIDEENFNVVEDSLKRANYTGNEFNDSFKDESDNIECNNSSECSFNLDTPYEFDPFKNVRMSIRRKRLTSNCSVLSNNEGTTMKNKENSKRYKRKCLSKGSHIITSKEPYLTNANNEHSLLDSEFNEVSSSTTLEVPRWRVKLYTSCYTMEGTENLDDEVYNKRHLRLEIDERRRKRWDVQRIREQRVIEKLKQRHEKGSKSDEHQDGLFSFWPRIEDIRYIEITEELPVTAFGYPIPKIFPRKM